MTLPTPVTEQKFLKTAAGFDDTKADFSAAPEAAR
jgi:hypothetical protein